MALAFSTLRSSLNACILLAFPICSVHTTTDTASGAHTRPSVPVPSPGVAPATLSPLASAHHHPTWMYRTWLPQLARNSWKSPRLSVTVTVLILG